MDPHSQPGLEIQISQQIPAEPFTAASSTTGIPLLEATDPPHTKLEAVTVADRNKIPVFRKILCFRGSFRASFCLLSLSCTGHVAVDLCVAAGECLPRRSQLKLAADAMSLETYKVKLQGSAYSDSQFYSV